MIELRDISEACWGQVQASPAKKKSSSHSEFVCSGKIKKPNILLNVSPEGAYRMLIDVPDRRLQHLEKVSTAGLNVDSSVLNVEFRPSQKWAVVSCTARAHVPAFTHIVKEISGLILKDRCDPVEAINSVIGKWKSFWGKPPGSILTEDEQMGLIGELMLLRVILVKKGSKFVKSWVGPLGGHDFKFKDWNIEVKTTSRATHSHVINGIDQLAAPQGKKLFLVSKLAVREESRGITLPAVVESIGRSMVKSPADYNAFASMLAAARYRLEHERDYISCGFTFTGEKWFDVDAEFPKLTSADLKQTLSSRISAVRYQLDLEGLRVHSDVDAVIDALRV